MSDSVRAVADFVALWSGEAAIPGAPELVVGPLLTFNRWARTSDLDGDVRVLVVEQQGVRLWGHSPRLGFVERENEPGAAWRPTSESDAEFWLHHAAFEFVCSRFAAYRSTNDVPSAISTLVADATDPLPCREWAWPGQRQHMRYRGRSIAMICEDEGYHYIQVGAPDEAALAWADNLGIAWSESDSRSG